MISKIIKHSFIFVLILMSQTTYSQMHKFNMGLDFSYGPHYYRNDISNPFAGNFNLGYEWDFLNYLGVEVGFKMGGFSQDIDLGYEISEFQKNMYKGYYYAPYVAPKFYLPIYDDDKSERSHSLFLENKISYTYSYFNNYQNSLLSKRSNQSIDYEIKIGYLMPLHNKWDMSFWLGYNSFDFSRIDKKSFLYKTSTPIQIGIGFSYIINSH